MSVLQAWLEKTTPGRAAFLLAILALLAFAAAPTYLSNDIACYYAPQVREFAAGHYAQAGYHMIPPLTVWAAGLVAKLGIAPFTALKLVNGLFLLLGLWPLWRLVRLAGYDGRTAGWCALLYAASARLVRYAGEGGVDAAKVCLLLFLAWQLLEYRRKPAWGAAAGSGLALGGLALARGEGIFFTVFALGWMLLFAIADQPGWKGRLRALFGHAIPKSLLALAVAAAVVLPQALLVRRCVGLPAPDSRLAWKAQQVLGLPCRFELKYPIDTVKATRADGSPAAAMPAPVDEVDRVTWKRNLVQAAEGLSKEYLALALLGLGLLAWQRRRRQAPALEAWDLFAASLILFNIALFAANGFIVKRYTIAGIPFLLPWAATGLLWLKDGALSRRLGPLAAHAIVALFVGICWLSSFQDLKPSELREAPPRRVVGEWIGDRRQQLSQTPDTALSSSNTGIEYHNGRQPKVLAVIPQYAYYAAGDWIELSCDNAYPYERVVELARSRQADLAVVDDKFLRTCPEFETRHADHFLPLETPDFTDPDGDPIRLYRFVAEPDAAQAPKPI